MQAVSLHSSDFRFQFSSNCKAQPIHLFELIFHPTAFLTICLNLEAGYLLISYLQFLVNEDFSLLQSKLEVFAQQDFYYRFLVYKSRFFLKALDFPVLLN